MKRADRSPGHLNLPTGNVCSPAVHKSTTAAPAVQGLVWPVAAWQVGCLPVPDDHWRKGSFSGSLTVTEGAWPGATPAEADFYVATNGNDRWSGTLAEPNAAATDGPFASLVQARDAIRSARANGRAGNVCVLIRGGRYYLEETVVSGIERDGAIQTTDTVTYAAYPGEEPIFSAGRHVPGWRRRQEWYLTLYLPPLQR